MIADTELLNDLRRIASQEASIPALHASLFLFAGLAAFAWARRRPRLALMSASVAGLLGLAYWLIQVVNPLGFSTDPMLTRAWAQAGVNALAEPRGAGFVWGTEAEGSLASALASAGVPLHIVALAPQATTFLALGVLILLPFALLRNKTTAAFAACLGLGGGLWPGVAPYGSILLRPSVFLTAAAIFGVLLLLGRWSPGWPAPHRSRVGIFMGLVALSAIARAFNGSPESTVIADLLLYGATVVLTPSARAILRCVVRDSGRAIRGEAIVLLCILGGSGLFWWNPPRSVPGFHEARNPSPALRAPMEWIRQNVPPTSVVLASPEYSAPIAAFSGRRVLFRPPADEESLPPIGEPFRRARLWESTRLGHPLTRLAEAFSATHLLLGPGEPDLPTGAAPPQGQEARSVPMLVYRDAEDFRVFWLAKK